MHINIRYESKPAEFGAVPHSWFQKHENMVGVR